MRKGILGVASAVALASPAIAADLPVTGYDDAPTYQREVHTYEYRTAPPVVVSRPAPVITDTIVVRRPIVVAPPPVVVEEYPVYDVPRVYARPRVYAYDGPIYRGRWGHGHRGHFRGGW